MVNLVFLHGMSDREASGNWLTGLRDSLKKLGYDDVDDQCIFAPQYGSLLAQESSPDCPLPRDTTEKPADQLDADRQRWEYERRQAALEELLGAGYAAQLFSAPAQLPRIALTICRQAQQYVSNDGIRGCVLQTVLKALPTTGELVIVGHSLGSLVAIDVLDCLPSELVVRRLVTIGSPAGHVVMHGKQERLLKSFSLTRVKSWANVWSIGDPVPLGRGIAHLFPQALDVRVNVGPGVHAADDYLRNPIVARAIGEGLFGSLSRDLVKIDSGVDIKLEDNERWGIAWLAYGHLVVNELKKDRRRQERLRAALVDGQQRILRHLAALRTGDKRAFPQRLAILADGRPPEPGALFDTAESIPVMLSFAGLQSVVPPYEISVPSAARQRALQRLATFLRFRESHGASVFQSFITARRIVAERASWSRWGWAAAGAGLLLAGPLGIMMSVPAGLSGGAAIVSALAGFGPGGMMGGLATAGVLTGAGGGAAAKALQSAGATEEAFEYTVVRLLATAIAKSNLKLPHDESQWRDLCHLESEITRERQRSDPFDDPDAPTRRVLMRKATAVRRAIEYLVDHGLAPVLT